jgi:hypothetical protein
MNQNASEDLSKAVASNLISQNKGQFYENNHRAV